jgi:hypothetical protein
MGTVNVLAYLETFLKYILDIISAQRQCITAHLTLRDHGSDRSNLDLLWYLRDCFAYCIRSQDIMT